MLVRRIARPLLASTFFVGGLDALRHPETKAPRAEKLDIPNLPGMDKLHITTTEQAVRVNAAVQVAGAALLSTGRTPRLASIALAATLVPTTVAGHAFWAETDPAQKSVHQMHFFKNLSVLGGLMIAAVDTAGKESVAHKTKRVTKRSKRKAAQSAAKSAAKASKKAARAKAETSEKLHDLLPI